MKARAELLSVLLAASALAGPVLAGAELPTASDSPTPLGSPFVGIGLKSELHGGMGLRWFGSDSNSMGSGCPPVPVVFVATGQWATVPGGDPGELVLSLESHVSGGALSGDFVADVHHQGHGPVDADDLYAPWFIVRSFRSICYPHVSLLVRDTFLEGDGVVAWGPVPLLHGFS